MAEAPDQLSNRIYAKTPLGLQEIQTRELGLAPLLRRLLVLIDGKRSAADLAPFVAGHDLTALLAQLVENGCVEEQVVVSPAPSARPKAVLPPTENPLAALQTEAALAGLPPAEGRSEKDIQMARTFMMNTINTMFAQHSRLTLVEAIHACKTAEALRHVYVDWAKTMATSSIGAKRLPELSRQLFTTL